MEDVLVLWIDLMDTAHQMLIDSMNYTIVLSTDITFALLLTEFIWRKFVWACNHLWESETKTGYHSQNKSLLLNNKLHTYNKQAKVKQIM